MTTFVEKDKGVALAPDFGAIGSMSMLIQLHHVADTCQQMDPAVLSALERANHYFLQDQVTQLMLSHRHKHINIE